LIVLVAAILAAAQPAVSPAQSLRTCADRWNQGNMVGWGPALVRVSARPRCKVRVAEAWKPDSKTGCAKSPRLPGDPRYCVDPTRSLICDIDSFGAYTCTWVADGSPPLGKANARMDARGVLTLSVPLAGTHATPPLAWHRRYPHADGWIFPWTHTHTLRRGLRFAWTVRGHCVSRAYEGVFPKGTLRCLRRGDFAIYQPCFRQRRGSSVVACAGWPGDTRFSRLVTG
jgi:hypothetical protein